MRNKKFLTLLAAVLLAGSLGTGTILASAGTVESKPAGDGLITSKNEINLTNFKVLEQAEGDADAYVWRRKRPITPSIITTANGRKCWWARPCPRRRWRKRA